VANTVIGKADNALEVLRDLVGVFGSPSGRASGQNFGESYL